MIIAIEEWYVYGAIIISFFLFLISLFLYMSIKNNAPDAWTHWKAKKDGKQICRVHYKGRKCVDHIAEIDKAEKEIGTPYWTVPTVGIKFKPEPEDIEFIEGTVPCCNYFESIPEAQKIAQVVAFSHLKDYFAKIGMPIDGIEDIALYVASESEKMPGDRAVFNAKIDSEETKKYLTKYLQTINANKKEIEKMKLQSGVFTWQIAMKALDSTIAYTSSHIAHMKETIRAAILRQEENKRKDYIMYAIIAFILCIGAAAFIVVTRQ
jgi:hypothetical protein